MSKELTPEDVARLFPERSVALFRAERGEHGHRKMTWVAQWGAGYFTSDTGRHVGFDGRGEQFFGETSSEALGKLVAYHVAQAHLRVEYHRKELREAEDEARAAEQLVAPALGLPPPGDRSSSPRWP